ncbi:MAG TPA: hypothetical protein VFF73_01960, partial [Planctomycetota bacterium]|nr:hypothetical protein [Planctomycetota bacterium]
MRRPARILCALIGGAFHAMAFAPFGFWPLAFVGVVLLLRSLREASVGDGLLAGLVWGAAGLAFPARWALHAGLQEGENFPRAVLPLLVLALAPTAFALVHTLARGDVAALLAPFAWIALEDLRTRVPFAPCASFTLAHALTDRWARPFSQMAELGGAASISLLVVAASVLIERGLSLFETNRSRATVHLVLGHGITIITWQIGFQILVSAVPIEAQLKSAFQTVISQAHERPEDAMVFSLRGLILAQTEGTPDVHAAVWPDGIWRKDPVGKDGLDPTLAKLAALFGRVIVFGAPRPGGEAVLAFARDGHLLAEHREGATSVVDVSDETLGLVFSDELDDPGVVRRLVAHGATFIIAVGREPAAWPPEARDLVLETATLR